MSNEGNYRRRTVLTILRDEIATADQYHHEAHLSETRMYWRTRSDLLRRVLELLRTHPLGKFRRRKREPQR